MLCHDRSVSTVAWLGGCLTTLLPVENAVMTHTELFLTCATVIGNSYQMAICSDGHLVASLLVPWLPCVLCMVGNLAVVNYLAVILLWWKID